jgi:ATP-dependent RNA helicase MSS116, mitochondrial
MFSSVLRRQSPALLRTSLRALTANSLPRTVFHSSLRENIPTLCVQHRPLSISSFLRDQSQAAEVYDSDPPANEYTQNASDSAATKPQSAEDEPITRFQQLADRGLVDPAIIDTITKGLGYVEMTKVQRKTILETLGGEDV